MKVTEATVGLITVGCKLNQYETEGIAERLEEIGLSVVPFSSRADVYVVNTCTVTARSDYKSRQMIRRAARKNPDALVIATGCYAEREPASLTAMPEVDLVVGNTSKPRLPELVMKRLAGRPWSDPEDVRADAARDSRNDSTVPERRNGKTLPERRSEGVGRDHGFSFFDITGFRGYTRAFVKIQDGCDRRCAYCAVPDARGPARSRPFEEVMKQAAVLGSRGYREIVLTGVHIGAYSDDQARGLADLVEALIELDSVDRVRLGSVEPTELTPGLAEAIVRSPKVCNHLHVPLESGSDAVLARMRRGYTREQYREAITRVTERDPLCGLGTDVMVGFPGETEEDFADTVSLIESLPFTYLHVFSFSPRRGTVAAGLGGQVPAEEARMRSGLLIDLGKRRSLEFRRGLVGETLEVLIEDRPGRAEDRVSGLASNYVRVETEGDSSLGNRLARIRIRGADSSSTWGSIEPGGLR
ncbi:MAG: tRNA (N(6)-L-threonylcarbamoyladenosine(37)-C(2))-methylthiotransferase MtaB [Candidatus Eisenbacteria bacterium]|nr:tRNA (N(6)-L-threonylcarbamoyladenosine(37)-C(2))-methylthiotransferase MtaB [Candidatus Eisenbacteria bacterium]